MPLVQFFRYPSQDIQNNQAWLVAFGSTIGDILADMANKNIPSQTVRFTFSTLAGAGTGFASDAVDIQFSITGDTRSALINGQTYLLNGLTNAGLGTALTSGVLLFLGIPGTALIAAGIVGAGVSVIYSEFIEPLVTAQIDALIADEYRVTLQDAQGVNRLGGLYTGGGSDIELEVARETIARAIALGIPVLGSTITTNENLLSESEFLIRSGTVFRDIADRIGVHIDTFLAATTQFLPSGLPNSRFFYSASGQEYAISPVGGAGSFGLNSIGIPVTIAGQQRTIDVAGVYIQSGDGTPGIHFWGSDDNSLSTELVLGLTAGGRITVDGDRHLVVGSRNTDIITVADSNGTNSEQTLLGYAGDDYIAGGRGADVIDGGDGNDQLVGGLGADRIIGGAGNDLVRGAVDGDTVSGGSGEDTWSFSTAAEGLFFDVVGNAISARSLAAFGTASAFQIEAVVGSGFADTFRVGGAGSGGALVTLTGGGGADSYRLSATGSPVFIVDSSRNDSLFVGDTLLRGNAVQSVINPSIYAIGGYLLQDLGGGDFGLINGIGANVIAILENFADGDFDIDLVGPDGSDNDDNLNEDEDGDGVANGNEADADTADRREYAGQTDPGQPTEQEDSRLGDARGSFARSTQELSDPLVLDLDGDGIELTNRDAGFVLFDIDEDGEDERVGWVAPDDGFLALDENGNGRIDGLGELFGNVGQLGFAELALYDTHRDTFGGSPVIDSRDEVFSRLLVWRDLNQNGRSEGGELFTVQELGITSISLEPTSRLQLSEGNLIFEDAPYSGALGPNGGTIAEVFLSFSEITDPRLPGPVSGPGTGAWQLPESRGYGLLPSWSRAGAANPAFVAALQALNNLPLNQLDEARGLTEALMFVWAGVADVDPRSRGGGFDARALRFMEALFGQGFVTNQGNTSPNAQSIALLQQTWNSLVDLFTERALVQGPLAFLFPDAEYEFPSDSFAWNTDFAGILERLGTLESDEVLAVAIALEPILQTHEAEFDMFPGQSTYEVALLVAEFGADDVLFGRLRGQFFGIEQLQLQPPIAGGNSAINYFSVDGSRVVLGTAANDRVSIFSSDPNASFLLNGFDGNDTLEIPGSGYYFGGAGDDLIYGPQVAGPLNPISEIIVYAGIGNDLISLRAVQFAEIHGGDGNDQIAFGGGTDQFGRNLSTRNIAFGGAGDDIFAASGTHNVLFGEAGDDTFQLGDSLFYNPIRYTVYDGGDGDDRFVAELRGSLDYATALGGNGDDYFRAVVYHSYVDGGAGNDTFDLRLWDTNPGSRATQILGGDGDDVFILGRYNYFSGISTLAVSPVIDPGSGDDRLAISDRSTFTSAPPVILSSPGRDLIEVSGQAQLRVTPLANDVETVVLGSDHDFSIDLQAFTGQSSLRDMQVLAEPGAVTLMLGNGQTVRIEQAGRTDLAGLAINFGTSLATTDGSSITGLASSDRIVGLGGVDIFYGGLGNDTLDGGSNVDTAVVSGNRSQYTVTQTSLGVFQVMGPDGTDTLTAVEFLQFSDQTIRLLSGTGLTVNFESANPATYQAAMNNIRDFDGNALGGNGAWLRIGSADVNGDGDVDQILVNDVIGRFATVGTAANGLAYFEDYGWAGETRVAGIYVDPLVQAGIVQAGSANDSQRRFQNDLQIENINRVLGANDYDNDGIWEVYFALTDGTAYLRALMHADGNIRYANYQSRQEVIDYLTANGFGPDTFAGWFTAPSNGAVGLMQASMIQERIDLQEASGLGHVGLVPAGTDTAMPGTINPAALAFNAPAFDDHLPAEFFG